MTGQTLRIPWPEWKAAHEDLFKPGTELTHHTAPIEHPVWVNVRDRIGDFIVPPVKWLWRWVLRLSDWVDRWAELIVGAIVAVVLILGVVLVLAFYDLRFYAILAGLFGLVWVTAVVAYKAGARTR